MGSEMQQAHHQFRESLTELEQDTPQPAAATGAACQRKSVALTPRLDELR
jgi:hypothetical protein